MPGFIAAEPNASPDSSHDPRIVHSALPIRPR